MRIVIVGGSGLIGSHLVEKLRTLDHEAIVASRSTGVNILTGEGLAEAFDGAQTVVDVSNSPSFEPSAVLSFFETAGRHIKAAEVKAGVRHHVALSVVGTDRLSYLAYMKAKLAQETLIRASSVPYTIVRATQFFEFMGAIADSADNGKEIRLPSVLMQPIAAENVAAALADYTLGYPLNDIVDIAGPEVIGMDAAARQFLATQNDPRQVVTDPDATYFGGQVTHRGLIPAGIARICPTRYSAWLNQHAQPLASKA